MTSSLTPNSKFRNEPPEKYSKDKLKGTDSGVVAHTYIHKVVGTHSVIVNYFTLKIFEPKKKSKKRIEDRYELIMIYDVTKIHCIIIYCRFIIKFSTWLGSVSYLYFFTLLSFNKFFLYCLMSLVMNRRYFQIPYVSYFDNSNTKKNCRIVSDLIINFFVIRFTNFMFLSLSHHFYSSSVESFRVFFNFLKKK